jgi:hypothetical protein
MVVLKVELAAPAPTAMFSAVSENFSVAVCLGETRPLSQGVQAGRKALRTRHINGVEVRKKRPQVGQEEAQGVQVSPLNPLSGSPRRVPPTRRERGAGHLGSHPIVTLQKQRLNMRGNLG